MGLIGKPFVSITCEGEKIWLGSPVDKMIETIRQLRREHSEVSTIELIQFGRGEFRVGSVWRLHGTERWSYRLNLGWAKERQRR